MRPIRFDSQTTSVSAWRPPDLSRTGGCRCARCIALPAPATDAGSGFRSLSLSLSLSLVRRQLAAVRPTAPAPLQRRFALQGVVCGPPPGGLFMRRVIFAVACFLSLQILALAQGERPLLLRHPTVSQTQIVFSFAGDLWIVAREGGDARRLTSGIGQETDPFFSPDGTQIAFSGEYDGNQDVYVVPAAGGVPKRLTYHPGADTVSGWTPDGRNITFVSTRASYYHLASQIYTVPTT